uniref:Uncharacterized protein n=1 Tax=viral metagenome TaxID=1070528 RepID=A0A6M3MB91_9ZZZZ
MLEINENEVKNLLKELDDAIMLITIAKTQRRLMFIKGVVRYVKSMAPKTVKEAFAEVNR